MDVAKTGPRIRPDIARRFFPEKAAIAFGCGGIPGLELVFFGLTALRWFMAERTAQSLATKPLPVGMGVEQVQMPDLIDLVGWRHGMARKKREENELPILGNRPGGVCVGPAVFSRQPRNEWKLRIAFVKAKLFDSLVNSSLLGIQLRFCLL